MNNALSPRWENYVLAHGEELIALWTKCFAARPRDVLFVLAKGFDPRMCVGIEALLRLGGSGKRDVLVVEFDEGTGSPSHAHAGLVEANWARLIQVHKGKGALTVRPIKMWSPDLRRVGSYNATSFFSDCSELSAYTDVFIDISAMPRTIYFPLIAKALFLVDSAMTCKDVNLHVTVCEDPALDRAIREIGPDDTADFVHPFRGGIDMEATAGQPKVWIPLLGEDQLSQLGRIYDLVVPDEISPVLPAPSQEPRRGDELLYEYRELLFDRLRIEPRNILYAAEHNPFEVYRQLRRTIVDYGKALQPLLGSKAVLSALSSKLMSLGALLVAYELKQEGFDIAVAHVEPQGYEMPADSSSSGKLFSLWLTGECYAE